MMRTRIVMVALLVVGWQSEPASACSMMETWFPRTNIELVASAERIVVALATTGGADPHDLSAIDMQVESVLKGTGVAAGDHVTVQGITIKGSYRGAAADPFDFGKARPGAYAGACVAYDYKIGNHYVLFLHHERGAWELLFEAFGRVNEDVDPASSPWITAITAYVGVEQLAAGNQRAAYDALIARAHAKGATAIDVAIGMDVARHLDAATPGKGFAGLEPMFQAAITDDERGRIALAMAASADPAAKAFMLDLVARLAARTTPMSERDALATVALYYDKVVDGPALAALIPIYIHLGKARQQDRWSLMWTLIHHASAADEPAMLAALASASDEEAGRFSEWFTRHPSEAARTQFEARVGTDYGGKSELALGLAGTGDAAIIAWAKAKLAAADDDDRWVAAYAIARSPRKDADLLAQRLIKANSPDLEALVQGYQDAAHRFVARRLKAIGKLKKLPAETRKWLERTLAGRAARQP